MFDLNTLVSPASELNLNFPTIINDRGEIAGQAQLPNGDIHAFLLVPCDFDRSRERECEEDFGGTATLRKGPAASLGEMRPLQGSLTRREIAAQTRARFGRNRGLGPWMRK
jgi:hypothetical protein